MICKFCKHDYPEDLISKTKQGNWICEDCIMETQELNAEMAEQRSIESGDIEYE